MKKFILPQMDWFNSFLPSSVVKSRAWFQHLSPDLTLEPSLLLQLLHEDAWQPMYLVNCRDRSDFFSLQFSLCSHMFWVTFIFDLDVSYQNDYVASQIEIAFATVCKKQRFTLTWNIFPYDLSNLVIELIWQNFHIHT